MAKIHLGKSPSAMGCGDAEYELTRKITEVTCKHCLRWAAGITVFKGRVTGKPMKQTNPHQKRKARLILAAMNPVYHYGLKGARHAKS